MLNMKFTPVIVAFAVIMSSPAYALEDVKVQSAKFALFNGSTPAIEKYFVSEGGADSLCFRTSGNHLITSESIVRSTLPQLKQNTKSGYGAYAMILDGECVKFVQQITNAKHTSNWIPGDKVTGYWDGSALVGKTIATFGSNGKYQNLYGKSHVGVVIAAWRSATGSGPIDSVWILDSNSVKGSGNGVIGRHRIDTSGGTIVTNLNNYYIVRQWYNIKLFRLKKHISIEICFLFVCFLIRFRMGSKWNLGRLL